MNIITNKYKIKKFTVTVNGTKDVPYCSHPPHAYVQVMKNK